MKKAREENLKHDMLLWLRRRKLAPPSDLIDAWARECGSREQAAEYVRQMVEDKQIICHKPELIKYGNSCGDDLVLTKKNKTTQ